MADRGECTKGCGRCAWTLLSNDMSQILKNDVYVVNGAEVSIFENSRIICEGILCFLYLILFLSLT